MDTSLLRESLHEHRFLQDLTGQQLDVIEGCAAERAYSEGEYLTRQGKPAEEFFLILDGRVAIEAQVPKRGALRLESVTGGGVVGWSWLVEPYHWHFDSRALSPVRTIVLKSRSLQNACESDPDLGYELLLRFSRLIEHRLQATRLQLLDWHQPEK